MKYKLYMNIKIFNNKILKQIILMFKADTFFPVAYFLKLALSSKASNTKKLSKID